jgi:hypothetical protein
MARSAAKLTPLEFPGEPNPDLIPIRYGDREQLAAIHHRYWGPLAPRSLERWPLKWRINNGRAVASVREFIGEAERRFAAAPVIRGGRQPKTDSSQSLAVTPAIASGRGGEAAEPEQPLPIAPPRARRARATRYVCGRTSAPYLICAWRASHGRLHTGANTMTSSAPQLNESAPAKPARSRW